jgi:hypothetical protein
MLPASQRFALFAALAFSGLSAAAEDTTQSTLIDQGWKQDARIDADIGFPPTVLLTGWAGVSRRFQWLPLNLLGQEAQPYTYSYVRPHVRYVTNYRLNQLSPRLDFFPVSFVGGTLGYVASHSDLNDLESFDVWSGYNCDLISCQGWNHTLFLEGKLKWALPQWALAGTFFARRDWISTNATKLTTFDPESALPFNSRGDHSRHFWILIGTNALEQHFFGVRARYLEWVRSDAHRYDWAALYTYSAWKPWVLGGEARWVVRNDRFDFPSITLRATYFFGESPEPEN